MRYATAEEFTNAFLAALAGPQPRRLQGAFSRRRRAPDRRRPVPRAQDAQRGGALPHLQRPLRRRQPARDHVRPPARRPRRARGPAARTLRRRPRHRHRAPRPRDARWRSCASARPTTASTLPAEAARAPRRARHHQRARPRGRADPPRRLRLATRRPLDARSPHDVLDRLGVGASDAPRAHRSTAIQEAACAHFGLTHDELLSRSRAERVVWPRQAAMYLAKELTEHSLPAIGRAFGGPRPHDRHLRLPARRRAHRRLRAGLRRHRGAHHRADALRAVRHVHRAPPQPAHATRPRRMRAFTALHKFTAPMTTKRKSVVSRCS